MSGFPLERLDRVGALTPRETRQLLDRLVAPASTDELRIALLSGLNARPLRASEVVDLAREMRRRAIRFDEPGARSALDLCGSGGARRPTFNVSTVSAFVVAAAGQPVAKHGNRSARSACGSSDLLEALGLPATTSRRFPHASFRRYRLAFLHAPLFHPATAAVAEARRKFGRPTIFNRLGPLVNPAAVSKQLVGSADGTAARIVARVLPALGVRRGLAVTSEEGTDEFSPRRASQVFGWSPDGGYRRRILPESLLDPEDRRGSWGPLSPPQAAAEAERILAGSGGARRGSVLLTSGAALWLAGRSPDLASGLAKAADALDSGAAERLLADLRALALREEWTEAS